MKKKFSCLLYPKVELQAVLNENCVDACSGQISRIKNSRFKIVRVAAGCNFR